MPQQKYRVVLASQSPARRRLIKELMQDLNLDIHFTTSPYEEDMAARKTPTALAKFLALNKALFVASKHPNSIIIGADTFGTLNGKNLGKPKTLKEARQMIQEMSENTMEVHTGLAVIKTNKEAKIIDSQTSCTTTKLTFAKIPTKAIEKIIHKDPVLQVAGALTIEGESGKYITQIHGDYHNVIGLPTFQLKQMLKEILTKE